MVKYKKVLFCHLHRYKGQADTDIRKHQRHLWEAHGISGLFLQRVSVPPSGQTSLTAALKTKKIKTFINT